jgi:hypothetical protein
MHQYIIETGNTVRTLLELLIHEESLIKEQTAKLHKAVIEIKAHGWNFQTDDLNDDFPEPYIKAAFFRIENSTAGADKLKSEIARYQAILGTHQSTTQTLCASILQIAKQGISLVHGSFLLPDRYIINTPPGRILASLTLRDIIWQACNQVAQCKREPYGKPVIDFFSELERFHGPQFSLEQHPHQSRAKQIIRLLGWLDYRDYVIDMQLLLS